jgi:hypothetical protein
MAKKQKRKYSKSAGREVKSEMHRYKGAARSGEAEAFGRRFALRHFYAALRQTAIGQKRRPSTPAADSAQVRCSRYAESLVTARASRVAKSTEAGTQERWLRCWVFTDGVQEGDRQGRTTIAALHAECCRRLSHSISSSARTRDISGSVRSRAFAVLRLTRNSNLVGCSIGKSAGFSPLRILST